jgi:polyisoprenoid-binding protein YceI
MRLSSLFVSMSLLAASLTAVAATPAKSLPLTGAIGFTGSKVTGSHDGNFKSWNGSVELKDGKAAGGKLEFTVQADSVECDVGHTNDWTPKLVEHLKSPDFFDVAKFPTATFKSTAIKADGAGFKITGNLTLHGVTKGVEFPATIKIDGKDIKGDAEFTINRKDFGIAYAGKADDLIRDGVVLKVHVAAKLP